MQKNKFMDILDNYGQSEFAKTFRSLDKTVKDKILKQADLIDFRMLKSAGDCSDSQKRGVITPMKTLTMKEYEPMLEQYRETGLKAIRAGKVGALLLSGGMGSRLGFEHAKGMYDIGNTREVYIFQRTIENLMEVVREAGSFIPLFIMTSYLNDGETREFFKEKNCFGYDPSYVSFFVQDMSPCLDMNGKMFFAQEDAIAMSPNGNGGFYSSFVGCGLDVKAKSLGVEYLNVFAVDNVLQKIADPVFVGAVIENGVASGAKVVVKATPDEKVGAICLEDGAPSVVEYYELTDEMRDMKAADMTPAYNYGVILNYLFRMEDIDRVVKRKLPVHMVNRKMAYFDREKREVIKPEAPNCYKLETLTLDLVHLVGSCLSFEVDRTCEFAPIKNMDGVDSVETAKKMLENNGYIL